MFLDFGHQRGQNKDADVARFEQRAYAWMDRYVKGDAAAPALEGVEALTQTCPKDAPSGGPYTAPTWTALHPGEVRFTSATPADGDLGRRRPDGGARVRPDRGRRRVRDDERGRRARHGRLPPAARRPATATRCSARRRWSPT